jgi:hypothetical protein
METNKLTLRIRVAGMSSETVNTLHEAEKIQLTVLKVFMLLFSQENAVFDFQNTNSRSMNSFEAQWLGKQLLPILPCDFTIASKYVDRQRRASHLKFSTKTSLQVESSYRKFINIKILCLPIWRNWVVCFLAKLMEIIKV